MSKRSPFQWAWETLTPGGRWGLKKAGYEVPKKFYDYAGYAGVAFMSGAGLLIGGPIGGFVSAVGNPIIEWTFFADDADTSQASAAGEQAVSIGRTISKLFKS